MRRHVPSDRSTLPCAPRLLVRVALCAVALLGAAASLAAGPPYRGRALDEVLRDLGTQGLRLIYSSELVPGSLL